MLKFLEAVWQDLRYGGRVIRQKPALSLTIVITVALGIGANATIFGVINAVLLEPLPYKDPDRLVRLWQSNPGQNQIEGLVSAPNFFDWQTQQTTFEQLGALELATFNLTGSGEPQRIGAARITANLIPTLGVAPALGRSFSADDVKAAVISDNLWRRQFGSDTSIVNKTIQLNGESYTVIGVMPAAFKFMGNRELWVPLIIDPVKEPWRADRANRNFAVFGRLKPDVTLQQAIADMNTVAQRLEPQNPGWGARLSSFYDWIVPEQVRTSMLALFIGVDLLLLIACANVANLLLARATTRQQEMAMRAALGASPVRLIRQLLIESLLLATLGGLLGLGLAFVATKMIASANMQNIARLSESRIDGSVLVFTFVITTLTGLIFGLAPAWWSARVNLTGRLKDGIRSETTQRLRGVLVISEVTMAAALLVTAGLLVNMLLRLQSVPLGLTPANVLTMQVSLPNSKYGDQQQRINFFQQAVERFRSVPGVIDAAAIEAPPTSGGTWTTEITPEGGEAVVSQVRTSANAHAITAQYFQTMQIPFLQGRDFAAQYRSDQPLEFVVSESFAHRYWPNESAIGKRFRPGANNPFGTVVGVVGDVKILDKQQDVLPAFYFPYGYIAMPGLLLVIRTSNQPQSFAAPLRAALRQLDAEQPVYNIRTMDEIVAGATSQQRFQATLSSLFAIVALLLVTIGIYSVMAYMVRQRRREIGVRIAVGATTWSILRMVIVQGMRNVFIGLGLGLIASLVLIRFTVVEVRASDLPVYLIVTSLLIGTALIACYLPAWRATKIDPATALRNE
jgi:putative ABC transport system permease protein